MQHGHWKTTTFVTTLRFGGLTAPLVVDGAINGTLFRWWVEQNLVLPQRAGDLVVMDNLSCHKVAAARQTIIGAGEEHGLLSALQPGAEPNRDGVFEVQVTGALAVAADGECIAELVRAKQPPVRRTRMPQSHPALRIPLPTNGTRSERQSLHSRILGQNSPNHDRSISRMAG